MPVPPEPASPSRSSVLGRKTVEDLLYHGFQARYLETCVRELARSGELHTDLAGFSVDVRSTVIARAMRQVPGSLGDVCFSGPMSPGPALAFGATPLEFLRHVSRRRTSPASARSGGLSWTDSQRGLFGWGGTRGTMTQVLAGAALAFKQRGEDRAAVVFEEYGALDSGGWHEGINLAGALGVPLIVVLEALRPASTADSARVREVATSYGIALEKVAEEPCERLFDMVVAARRRAVDGGGPVLIEFAAFSGSDRWALHRAFASWATAEGGFGQRDVGAIDKAAAAGVEHAAKRIGKELGPDPRAALVPVSTGSSPREPWTRRDPPRPDAGATVPAPVGSHVH